MTTFTKKIENMVLWSSFCDRLDDFGVKGIHQVDSGEVVKWLAFPAPIVHACITERPTMEKMHGTTKCQGTLIDTSVSPSLATYLILWQFSWATKTGTGKNER